MKKNTFSISLIFCFIFFTYAFAKDETNWNRFTISAAYEGSWLSYQERNDNGLRLDGDDGWLSGGFIELRYDSNLLFVRINSSLVYSEIATYTGSDMFTSAPITGNCGELISLSEISIGFKILNYKSFTLSPYNAFGYRFWERYIGYIEDYSWFYAAIGINLEYSINNWIFCFDASVDFPIYPQMIAKGFRYNYLGTKYNLDASKFPLQSIPGFKIEVNIRYNVYNNKDLKIFIFGMPYYQQWNIGASRNILQTQNGIAAPNPDNGSYFYLMEPDSRTHLIGLKFGVGINFL